jgi:hypothetical protein
MLGVSKANEVATSLLHIGGLSGAGMRLAAEDPWGALSITIVACLCVFLLTGSNVLVEVAKLKLRQYVRKSEKDVTNPERVTEKLDA